MAGLRSLVCNGLAAALLAFGAHPSHRPRRPAEPEPANAAALEPAANVVQLIAPPKRGSVSVFMSDRMKRAEGEQIGAGDLFTAYLDWCHARGHLPLDTTAFNARLSRQGCTAYQWIVHMRDRGLTGRCYEVGRSSDDDEPKTEPDSLDIFGQPGQR
jgi:hypothetical protein